MKRKTVYLVSSLLVYGFFSIHNVAAQEITISAEQLYNEYQANEIRADSMYKEKTLRVTGKIVDFNIGVFGSQYITLDTGHVFFSLGGVDCHLSSSETEKAANLSKGQRITVVGIGNGYSLDTIYLRRCVIVTPNSQSAAPAPATSRPPASATSRPAPRASAPQNTFQATHRVITNDGTNLRLRSSPGFNGQQIGLLDYGSYVKILETGAQTVDGDGYRGNWVRVSTPDGKTGWCFGAYLQAAANY
jgi:hypothetical protein